MRPVNVGKSSRPAFRNTLRTLSAAALLLLWGSAWSQAIGNGSFESPQIPSTTVYSTTADNWSFSSVTGVSGITANGSPFTALSPPTADGRQVALINGEGYATQTIVAGSATTCTASFVAEQRYENQDPTGIHLQLELDGAAVWSGIPVNTGYTSYTTGTFNVSAGTHSFAFHGLNPVGNDNSVFIDSVSLSCQGGGGPYQSAYIAQSVPTTMVAGLAYAVSVTMRNTGTDTWTQAGAYRLGSQNPQDNGTWGLGRVDVPTSVGPGQQVTFNFSVTAPATPGTYNFQWRMLQEGVTWFGDFTPNQIVTVNAQQSQQLYYGYFGNCSYCLAETAGHINLASHMDWGDWTTSTGIQNITNDTVQYLLEAKSRGITKAIVAVGYAVYLGTGTYGFDGNYQYRGDAVAAQNLQNLFSALQTNQVLDMVVALYPVDEPFNHGLGDAAIAMANGEIRSVASGYSQLQGVKLAVIYSPYRLPGLASYDWVGFDDYNAGTSIFNSGGEYDWFRAQVSGNQRVILVPGGYSVSRTDPNPFYQKAQADSGVIAIIPFVWFDQPGSWQGIRDDGMATAYCQVGSAIIGANPALCP
jgi:Ig-like domain from next to BRCA1 gene